MREHAWPPVIPRVPVRNIKEKPRRLPGPLFLVLKRELSTDAGVVLFVVDPLRFAILLLVDPGSFRRGKSATVSGTHIGLLAVQARLLVLDFCGFAGTQRTILDAFADALLLRAITLADFAGGVQVLSLRVVFLVVDLFRKTALLSLQTGALGGSQRATIRGLHALLFGVEFRFLAFQFGSFVRG